MLLVAALPIGRQRQASFVVAHRPKLTARTGFLIASLRRGVVGTVRRGQGGDSGNEEGSNHSDELHVDEGLGACLSFLGTLMLAQLSVLLNIFRGVCLGS